MLGPFWDVPGPILHQIQPIATGQGRWAEEPSCCSAEQDPEDVQGRIRTRHPVEMLNRQKMKHYQYAACPPAQHHHHVHYYYTSTALHVSALTDRSPYTAKDERSVKTWWCSLPKSLSEICSWARSAAAMMQQGCRLQ